MGQEYQEQGIGGGDTGGQSSNIQSTFHPNQPSVYPGFDTSHMGTLPHSGVHASGNYLSPIQPQHLQHQYSTPSSGSLHPSNESTVSSNMPTPYMPLSMTSMSMEGGGVGGGSGSGGRNGSLSAETSGGRRDSVPESAVTGGQINLDQNHQNPANLNNISNTSGMAGIRPMLPINGNMPEPRMGQYMAPFIGTPTSDQRDMRGDGGLPLPHLKGGAGDGLNHFWNMNAGNHNGFAHRPPHNILPPFPPLQLQPPPSHFPGHGYGPGHGHVMPPFDWKPPGPFAEASSQAHGSRSRRSTMTMTDEDGIGTEIGGSSPPSTTGARRGGRGRASFSSATTRKTGKKSGKSLATEDTSPVQLKKEHQSDDDGEVEEEKMDHRKRKRNRTIRSCVPCHNHKRKCDRKRPCGRCTALGLTGTCVYEVDEARDMNDPTVAESERLRRRIAELEQVVRELRQRNPARNSTSAPQSLSAPLLTVSDSNQSGMGQSPEGRGQDSKKRRVIVDRYARFKIDEAAMMAVAEANAAAGKSEGVNAEDSDVVGRGDSSSGQGHSRRSSGDAAVSSHSGEAESGGGKQKNYRDEPYSTYLLPGEEMVHDKIGRKTFLGAPAGRSMLRRLRELTSNNPKASFGDDHLAVLEDSAYTAVFPDLKKTFPFTTIWSHENFSGEIIGLLPSKEQSEVLLTAFKREVSAYFLAWHQPTLDAEYKKFFSMGTTEKMNVPLSSLALYLMMCSLGCVMRASRSEVFGGPDSDWMDSKPPVKSRDPRDLTSSRLQSELYLSGAFQALRLCSYLSNPTISSVQAQILVNIYLFNSERAADAWAQTGSLVRQCIAMGLHVDPASLDNKISLREAEVRRRIWWAVASLDALLCVSFGRPSVINFYKTNLPQDRPDDNLSDAPGTAQQLLPPSNVLSNETTDLTYHTATFQLTIPSYELLDRIFHVDRTYSRSAIYGWFSPSPEHTGQMGQPSQKQHTYEDAIRLAGDIFQWYSHIPRDMRFEADEDTPESLRHFSSIRTNQRMILCNKTFMIVMVLHRPYLRADPAAYPESTEICFRAAHQLLTAYKVGAKVHASSLWIWWTIAYRAFHAGAVCAFLAIRQPGTELARRCMEDLRGVIDVLGDRMGAWNSAHPVQADLCNGLVKLEKLATAATRQKGTTPSPAMNPTHQPRWSTDSTHSNQNAGFLTVPTDTAHIHHPSTPLSEIRGFPDLQIPSPGTGNGGLGVMGPHSATSGGSNDTAKLPSPLTIPPATLYAPEGFSLPGDGFTDGDRMSSLPQFWASMFNIKMEGDTDMPEGSDPIDAGQVSNTQMHNK